MPLRGRLLIRRTSFIGMIATPTTGVAITVYSNRFTLTGMTGAFPPGVEQDLAHISPGTSGPPAGNVAGGAHAAAEERDAAGGDPYAVPFGQQTGPTRYAAMQPAPGTKITATNTAPLHPTSAVRLASTPLPPPAVETTLTQAQTAAGPSEANTVRTFLVPRWRGRSDSVYRLHLHRNLRTTWASSSTAGRTEAGGVAV